MPRDAVSRTANVGTVGTNGLKALCIYANLYIHAAYNAQEVIHEVLLILYLSLPNTFALGNVSASYRVIFLSDQKHCLSGISDGIEV